MLKYYFVEFFQLNALDFQWYTTVSIRIVADSKALSFQFGTILYTKILTLNLAQKPLLFLYIVVHSVFHVQLGFQMFVI